MKTHNNILFFILIIVAMMATFFFIGNFKLNESIRLENEASARINNALQNILVEAKAVSVYNITTNKKIYGKNDEIILPIASLAKIMTVIVGLNGHSREEIVSVSPNAVFQDGDFGIFAYEKWKIDDIAKFTLIVSANDGAYSLAEGDEDFLEKMNTKAKKIGMENALFLNTTGLDLGPDQAGLPVQAGAFASAEDMNLMADYALKAYPEIFSATTIPELTMTSQSGFVHNFKNTNLIVSKIPNLLFSKTGFTETAGGNLTVVFKNKRGEEIAITVLGSTFEGRFSDMEKIVDVLYSL